MKDDPLIGALIKQSKTYNTCPALVIYIQNAIKGFIVGISMEWVLIWVSIAWVLKQFRVSVGCPLADVTVDKVIAVGGIYSDRIYIDSAYHTQLTCLHR